MQSFGQGGDKRQGFVRTKVVIPAVIGHQFRVAPHRLTIATPVATEGPTWQGFSGIPFPLAKVQQWTFGEPLRQASE